MTELYIFLFLYNSYPGSNIVVDFILEYLPHFQHVFYHVFIHLIKTGNFLSCDIQKKMSRTCNNSQHEKKVEKK